MPLTEKILSMPTRRSEVTVLALQALDGIQTLLRSRGCHGEQYIRANQLIDQLCAANREIGAMNALHI